MTVARRTPLALSAIVLIALAVAAVGTPPAADAQTDTGPLVEPARLVDTRDGAATIDGRQAGIGVRSAGSLLAVPVAGRAGIADDAASVMLNVTIVNARDRGYATVYSCDESAPPLATNQTYASGTTRAAFALSGIAEDGTVCVFVSAATDLVVDVLGSVVGVAPSAEPTRLLDTRPGETTADGDFAGIGTLAADETFRLPVAGRADVAGVAGDVEHVVVSVTAIRANRPGFVAISTCGTPTSTASLNFGVGDTISNTTFVQLDSAGALCIDTSAPIDLAVDVLATFDPGSIDLADPARRLLDTRPGSATVDGEFAANGVRRAGATLELQVAGRGGIPSDAGAALINVVAVKAQSRGFMTLYPGGTDQPVASHLNHEGGDTIANTAVTRLGADGQLCVFNSATTDVVVDVIGWLPGVAPSPDAGCPTTSTREPVFPTQRIVALYGNDVAAELGVLGEQPPDAAADRLAQIAAPYRTGDRPVTGAFELIATIATSAAGDDGLYRSVSSDDHVQRYLDAATANGQLLILDIQPGRADFLTEVQRYDRFIRRNNVHVALDPEWSVGPNEEPGEVVGQVDATEVNEVADYLSTIVAEEGLDEKMLVVHQFQDRMLTRRELLREPAGVAVTIHMDGFGTRQQKLNTYGVTEAEPPFHNGFKLFFDEDINIFQPGEVLAFDPVPDLITYQ